MFGVATTSGNAYTTSDDYDDDHDDDDDDDDDTKGYVKLPPPVDDDYVDNYDNDDDNDEATTQKDDEDVGHSVKGTDHGDSYDDDDNNNDDDDNDDEPGAVTHHTDADDNYDDDGDEEGETMLQTNHYHNEEQTTAKSVQHDFTEDGDDACDNKEGGNDNEENGDDSIQGGNDFRYTTELTEADSDSADAEGETTQISSESDYTEHDESAQGTVTEDDEQSDIGKKCGCYIKT